MRVPERWRKRYEIVRKSSGRAFADEWLNRKLQNESGRRSDVRAVKRGKGRGGNSGGNRGSAGDKVSRCAAEYAMLVVNPFVADHTACLPVSPSYPSRKVSTYAKGAFAVGSTRGMVIFSPRNMIANDNGTAPIYFSEAAWTGTAFTITPVASQIVAAQSNSPFASAEFGTAEDELQFRCIAAGLRILYTDTLLNRGGFVGALARADHRTLVSAGMGDLLAFDEATTYTPDGEWHELTWVPTDPAEYGYISSLTGTHSLGFMVEASNNLTFRYEAYAHFEVIGRGARGKTESTSDPVATGAIISGMQQNNGTTTVEQRIKDVTQAVKTAHANTQAAVGLWGALSAYGSYLVASSSSRPALEL